MDAPRPEASETKEKNTVPRSIRQLCSGALSFRGLLLLSLLGYFRSQRLQEIADMNGHRRWEEG